MFAEILVPKHLERCPAFENLVRGEHAEDAVRLRRQTAISFCPFIPVNSPPRDVFVVYI